MTKLDENRGKTQLAQRAGVPVSEVSNLAIWGNHSATQYPDFENAQIFVKRLVQKGIIARDSAVDAALPRALRRAQRLAVAQFARVNFEALMLIAHAPRLVLVPVQVIHGTRDQFEIRGRHEAIPPALDQLDCSSRIRRGQHGFPRGMRFQ